MSLVKAMRYFVPVRLCSLFRDFLTVGADRSLMNFQVRGDSHPYEPALDQLLLLLRTRCFCREPRAHINSTAGSRKSIIKHLRPSKDYMIVFIDVQKGGLRKQRQYTCYSKDLSREGNIRVVKPGLIEASGARKRPLSYL